jgi:hypothetical protein
MLCTVVYANDASSTRYPVLYGIQILPLSVVRWMGFMQETHGDRKNHLPPGAVIAVACIYNLSGISNIVLFLLTRRNLLLFSREDEDIKPVGHSSDSIIGQDKVAETDRDVDSIEGHHDDWQEYMNRFKRESQC